MAQYFLGCAYWKCGRYYQRRGKRLHRVVWEHHNGPIPKGFHVHHIDGDVENNAIDNLELLPASAHLKHHANHPGHIEYAKWHMEKRMRPRAVVWHRSAEGREWHSAQGQRNGALPPRFPFVCVECGRQDIAKQRNRKYCSDACFQRAFRRRNPGYYSELKKRRGL